MSKIKRTPFFSLLCDRLYEDRRFIQVLLGPRQVGKTTLALQVAEELNFPYHYANADLATLQDLSWIEQQWNIARKQTSRESRALFIIDEVQKIPNWSAMVKYLWDQDSRKKTNLIVIFLGSSPWLTQRDLGESLE